MPEKGKKQKTSTIKNDLNPVWNEVLIFPEVIWWDLRSEDLTFRQLFKFRNT